MTRLKAILVVSFILTFAAGLASGFLVSHLPPPHRGDSRLEAELKLNLTDAQRSQMDAIWGEVVGSKMRQWGEQREAARQQRDKAVNVLLTDDLRKKYDAVVADFAKKDADLRDAQRLEREKALAAVFPADVAPKYEAVQAEFAHKDADLVEQRRLAFDEAAKQTRVLLSPEQVIKYDGWIEKQRERGFGGPPRGGRRPPPPDGAPPPPPKAGE
jgi:hypothetical protein